MLRNARTLPQVTTLVSGRARFPGQKGLLLQVPSAMLPGAPWGSLRCSWVGGSGFAQSLAEPGGRSAGLWKGPRTRWREAAIWDVFCSSLGWGTLKSLELCC